MKLFNISILLSAFLLLGCQDDSKEQSSGTAVINKPLQAKIQNNSPAQEPTITLKNPSQTKSTAKSLGIVVEDGKIIIDTKQTKNFLRDIGDKMKDSFKKIEDSLRKEKIESTNETGIIIKDTKIQIDLNKTKNFMEKWMRSMESIVNELNKTMGEIEKNLPKR
ncbi:MAG: hypothetical protein HF962_09095 [Sulfurovum sp.]|nr:hypothetical protein [Sulfurovum sp.]